MNVNYIFWYIEIKSVLDLSERSSFHLDPISGDKFQFLIHSKNNLFYNFILKIKNSKIILYTEVSEWDSENLEKSIPYIFNI